MTDQPNTNVRNDLRELLKTAEKPKRKRPCYAKSQAIRDFEKEHKTWNYSSRRIPPQYQVLTTFRDDTANELTKLIVAYLRVNGAFATRLNSTGIYRADIKRYVRNTQRKGMADVVGLYQGRSLNRLGRHQEKIKHEIEQSGGLYFVARTFKEFKEWFENAEVQIGVNNGNTHPQNR